MLKHDAGDRRTPREPGSRRVHARASLRAAPPRPAALREPAPGAGGRATPHEKSKDCFVAMGTSQCCGFLLLAILPMATHFGQFFLPALGDGIRAAGLGWNLRKRRPRRGGFPVFRTRIGVKKFCACEYCMYSKRYEQRKGLEPRFYLSPKITGRFVLSPVGVGGLAGLATGLARDCPRPCRRNRGARRSPAARPCSRNCRTMSSGSPLSRRLAREKLWLPGTVLRGSGDVRLAVVVDLRLVLVVQRAEAAQRAPGYG